MALRLMNSLWLSIGGREEGFEEVVVGGWVAAHPDYLVDGTGCCNVDELFGATAVLNFEPRTITPGKDNLKVELRRDFRGRINYLSGEVSLPAPQTPLDNALSQGGGPPKENTRRYLDSLPSPVLLSALIEFRQALNQETFDDFRRGFGVAIGPTTPIFLTPPYGHSPQLTWNQLTWPNPSVNQFQKWAGILRPHDDTNLDALGLPDSGFIKEIAEEGTIKAFFAVPVSVRTVHKLLDDPAVATVRIVEVAFNLGQGST
jgi:hypothetical protein